MGNILVDTSVWIDYFRNLVSPYGDVLDQLLQEDQVCTTNLIKAEIIPSAATLKQFHELEDYFQAIELLEAPSTLWEEVIEVQFRLKRKGINGASIPDLIIAVVANAYGKVIFTKDSDFKLIQRVFPIQLLEVRT